MGRIYLNGIKIYAYHGCLKEENKIGSYYKINLMVKSNLEKPSKSDLLIDTIDYSTLYEIVEKEMSIKSSLIEHVCDRVLKRTLGSSGRTQLNTTNAACWGISWRRTCWKGMNVCYQ